MHRLTVRLLRKLALDLPIYREMFARGGGGFAALLAKGASYSYEGRLRGLLIISPVEPSLTLLAET